MPFELKNVRATYQRLVNKVFEGLIDKTIAVDINDMLVKSLQAKEYISHLEECFGLLRQYQMRLNPTKYSFGVTSGKFLGYLVTK